LRFGVAGSSSSRAVGIRAAGWEASPTVTRSSLPFGTAIQSSSTSVATRRPSASRS
jgi:hypothetical protein